MIKAIIDGICLALNEEFGDDYTIYTDGVKQGLEEPCFSIVPINPNNSQFLGSKYYRENLFCIHYFPESEEKVSECLDVLERLYDCLEIIEINSNKSLGINMNGEINDGVLSFFINYNLFVIKEKSEVPMEDLELSQSVK